MSDMEIRLEALNTLYEEMNIEIVRQELAPPDLAYAIYDVEPDPPRMIFSGTFMQVEIWLEGLEWEREHNR